MFKNLITINYPSKAILKFKAHPKARFFAWAATKKNFLQMMSANRRITVSQTDAVSVNLMNSKLLGKVLLPIKEIKVIDLTFSCKLQTHNQSFISKEAIIEGKIRAQHASSNNNKYDNDN